MSLMQQMHNLPLLLAVLELRYAIAPHCPPVDEMATFSQPKLGMRSAQESLASRNAYLEQQYLLRSSGGSGGGRRDSGAGGTGPGPIAQATSAPAELPCRRRGSGLSDCHGQAAAVAVEAAEAAEAAGSDDYDFRLDTNGQPEAWWLTDRMQASCKHTIKSHAKLINLGDDELMVSGLTPTSSRSPGGQWTACRCARAVLQNAVPRNLTTFSNCAARAEMAGAAAGPRAQRFETRYCNSLAAASMISFQHNRQKSCCRGRWCGAAAGSVAAVRYDIVAGTATCNRLIQFSKSAAGAAGEGAAAGP